MMKRFKEAGALISFDVNFRGNLWTGNEARECIEEILPYVDIFFCSEDTARLTFLKEGDAKSIMKSFTETYPISVIYDARKNTFYEEEPYRNIEVVDRIGSGDAYVSGVLYGLLSKPDDCQRALEIGNATSAVKNTIPGDLPSSDLREIETVIKAHKTIGPQLEMER